MGMVCICGCIHMEVIGEECFCGRCLCWVCGCVSLRVIDVCLQGLYVYVFMYGLFGCVWIYIKGISMSMAGDMGVSMVCVCHTSCRYLRGV